MLSILAPFILAHFQSRSAAGRDERRNLKRRKGIKAWSMEYNSEKCEWHTFTVARREERAENEAKAGGGIAANRRGLADHFLRPVDGALALVIYLASNFH